MRYLILLLMCGVLFGATETRQPDGDVDADGWTTAPLFSKIDEGSGSPDGTYIVCDEDNNYTDEVSIQDPTNAGTYTAVEVKVYARKSATGGDVRGVDCDLRINEEFVGGQVMSADIDEIFTEYSNSWTGLSYDEADMATLQVIFTATGDTGDPAGRDIHIDYIEVVLTYTAAGAVSHHQFFEY
jgi:hypothetical protein